MARRPDSGMLGEQPRRNALAVAVNLYRGDTTFRWFVDLALIGGIILTFLHGFPLRIPSLSEMFPVQTAQWQIWTGGTPKPNPKIEYTPLSPSPSLPSFGSSSRPNSIGPLLPGFATAPRQLEPGMPPPRKSGIDRSLFASSSAETQLKLNAAADAYEYRNAVLTQNALDGADAEDVNVIALRGMATLAQFSPENIVEGQRLLGIAADRGHRQAQTFLGYLLISGPVAIKRDPEHGRVLLEMAADAGDVTAATILLHAYQAGWVGIVDKTRAKKYMLRAAELGDPRAAFAVAYAHLTGRGLPKDQMAALRYGLIAAEAGHRDGQALIGGVYLEHFIAGATTDLTPAIEWLERAAKNQEPMAMPILATIYLSIGKGTPWHDPAKGVQILRRCVETMWSGGCFYAYAGVLQDGIGTPQDLVAAHAYNTAALEAGTTSAKERLAGLERMLTPAELEEAREQARIILRRKPVMTNLSR